MRDGRTDGRTDGVKPIYPPTTSLCGGIIMAWQHQAITWTNVDLSSVRSGDIQLRAISQEMPQQSIAKFSLKIINTYLKCHSNLPGANDLTLCLLWMPPSTRLAHSHILEHNLHLKPQITTMYRKVFLHYIQRYFDSFQPFWSCQPYQMGHGQHPNLKMDMNEWWSISLHEHQSQFKKAY